MVMALLCIASALGTERQSVRGDVPVAATRLQPVGRLPGGTRLNLAIGLPVRNQDELRTLLERLYDPASPQYRHYLTPEQFAERFGPTKEDYEALRVWAESKGLAVTGTHPNRTLLDVTGSVEDIEKVFQVKLQVYQHPTEARMFHAPDVEPSLDLGVRVLRIGGLDTFSVPRPLAHRSPTGQNRGRKGLSGSGPAGGYMGNDFRAAYVPGVALTGAGESVALIEFDSYYESDITNYESLAGLPNVPLQHILLSGATGIPGDTDTVEDEFEVAVDIEMAISMAPGLAKVIVYEGAPGGWTSPYDVLNRIATDNAANQISSSWTLSFDVTTDQIFQQYAAQGQSFFQASGDQGAYPGGWFADDNYLTAVGGTELTTSGPGGGWVSETVWNFGYVLIDNTWLSSGGGTSLTNSIAGWQNGVHMTANGGSTTRRNIPDVAMVADNIWVRWNNGDSAKGDGTSFAAPLWAAFTALANQLAKAKGQPPVGFINPAIYALGKGASYNSFFHDIATGSNTNGVSPTEFFAVPGYDLCTGWGTPNGSNLLYALALPERLQITPGTNLTAGGQTGGPFIPAAQTYSLTNTGAAPLDWTLATTVSWLDLSTTSGTLATSGPAATVTVSLNSDANHLPPGNYAANLWFTNLSTGSVQGRTITLGVFSVPVVVSGPVSQTVPEGGTATFTVVAAQIGPVSYQWTRNGVLLSDDGHISGSTNSTLIISNVSAADAASYNVLVANSIGGYNSLLAVLTVVPSPPVIVTEPTNQTVLPGVTVTFAVQAAGTPPLSYQWQDNGTNVTSSGNTNTLTLRNISPVDAGVYSVIVSNALGTVTNRGAILAVIPVIARGVSLTTLHSFTGGDGANPLSTLVQGQDRILYGTTLRNGPAGYGTAYRITTNGALTTLHGFSGGTDGGYPNAGLVQAADGNFYGTTYLGGQYGYGTAFRITTNGALTTLHAFSGGTDGGYAISGLIQATDGLLYGTATYGNGGVFRMTTSGTFTPLVSFNDANGADPRGGLVQASDGDFYGTTHHGGTNGDGTVFKMTATGTLTTLFAFHGVTPNPSYPTASLVQGRDGNFYGTTPPGGADERGAVFRITPTGQLTTLYSFTAGSDSQWPFGGLLEGKDGYFYGTTSYAGTGFDGLETGGQGTVFRMTPRGVLTTLAYFVGPNGAAPATHNAALMQATDGNFYGTTFSGGSNGYGTVFRLSVPEPTLSIALSGSQIVLSWPAWASDLVLQQTSDLTTGSWAVVTNASVVTNLQKQVTFRPAPGGNGFYRLTH